MAPQSPQDRRSPPSRSVSDPPDWGAFWQGVVWLALWVGIGVVVVGMLL